MPTESDSMEQTCVLTGATQAPVAAAPGGYPLITICIPTRNRSSLLKACVESALTQTYQNIEVLVSDNASTDDTLAVLESMDDGRLRILRNREDIGGAENFANCIREARGDYLVDSVLRLGGTRASVVVD